MQQYHSISNPGETLMGLSHLRKESRTVELRVERMFAATSNFVFLAAVKVESKEAMSAHPSMYVLRSSLINGSNSHDWGFIDIVIHQEKRRNGALDLMVDGDFGRLIVLGL